MSNSRTSDASRAYQAIKELFAEISGAANAAVYERVGVGEAYARITDALSEIDGIIDTNLSRAPMPEQDEDVTLSGNPHVYQGGKW